MLGVSLPVYAADVLVVDVAQVQDSGYQDSGMPEIQEPDQGQALEEQLAADVRAIREDVHFALYGLLPLGIAILVLVLGCWWFNRTFVRF